MGLKNRMVCDVLRRFLGFKRNRLFFQPWPFIAFVKKNSRIFSPIELAMTIEYQVIRPYHVPYMLYDWLWDLYECTVYGLGLR
jgi:hypothetical protein